MASIPPPPTSKTLAGYLQNLHSAVASAIGSVREGQADELLEVMKQQTSDPSELGKGATGLWLAGEPEWAVLIAGKVCMIDPSYAENVNNYAALLTMMDAQHAAVPLLQYLNDTYPGNPTILSNLGQAWFGLGDIKKSEQYLDSAIQRFPKHSKANETKSEIQEQRGDKKGAAESLKKSMEQGFTSEKDARLRRLGYPADDVAWPLPMPQDPMGLHRLVLPDFPTTVEDCELARAKWEDFHRMLNQRTAELEEKHARAGADMQNEANDLQRKRMAAIKSGRVHIELGPLLLRAGKKLAYLMSDRDGSLTYRLRKVQEDVPRVQKELSALQAARDAKRQNALKGLDCGRGEGSRGKDLEKCCRKANEISNDYLLAANTMMRESALNAMKEYSRYFNSLAYYQQYTMQPNEFEWKKLEYQLAYLAMLQQIGPAFENPGVFCEPKREDARPFKPGKGLAEFDVIACKYNDTLNLVVFKIETQCSRMTTKLDFGKYKLSFTEDLNKNREILPGSIVGGSVDVSVGVGTKGIGKWGPVKAKVGADVDLHVEFTGKGITEVSASVSVKADVGTEIFDKAEKVSKILEKGEYEVEKAIKYMEKTGNTALIPYTDTRSASFVADIATITINAGSDVTTRGNLNGIKLK